MPWGLFRYNRVIILELGERKRFRRSRSVRVRQATEEDLEALASLPGRQRMPDVKGRWARGDRCCLAEVNGVPVGATWITFGKYPMKELDCCYDPGEDGIFLYDAYTVPAWRLKGIHVDVLEYLLDRYAGAPTVRVYCGVEQWNDFSLRTHVRFGFRILQYLTYAKVLGLRWYIVKSAATGKSRWLLGWGEVCGEAEYRASERHWEVGRAVWSEASRVRPAPGGREGCTTEAGLRGNPPVQT